MQSGRSELSGRPILVTGGTGFIGGRLIERLVLDCKADVRVLVRNFARAVRIARFPVKMIYGDVTKPSDVKRAVEGCEIVFHCAALGAQGSKEVRRRVNVEGTRNIFAAALQVGVSRVIHLSSLMVYGATPDGDLDETAPRRYSGNIYSDTKLDGEKVASDYVEKHGLPVTILQPTCVYGPFGGYWTTETLDRLKTGRTILVNGGDGLCNAVYVDDVVSAMLLAALRKEAIGEAFLVSGERPVTWQNFFGKYALMLGVDEGGRVSASDLMRAHEARQGPKRRGILGEALSIWREDPLIRRRFLGTTEVAVAVRVAQRLLPKSVRQSLKKRLGSRNGANRPRAAAKAEGSTPSMDPSVVQFYAAKTWVRIDKAKRLLGYQPSFDLEAGMRLTEQWARWAKLL